MIKWVTHAHLGPIWYNSESWLGLFFAVFYSKTALAVSQSLCFKHAVAFDLSSVDFMLDLSDQ